MRNENTRNEKRFDNKKSDFKGNRSSKPRFDRNKSNDRKDNGSHGKSYRNDRRSFNDNKVKSEHVKTELVEIKRLGINGEGIGYINRKITFVKGALPGEKVEVEITSDEQNYKEATVVNVVEASEHRKRATCPIQGRCLNCPLMIMDDESIMYFKKDIIRDSLRKYTKVDYKRIEMHNPILSEDKVNYVNEINLPVVDFNDKPRVGIYQRGSKFLTVMDECQLYHPIIRKVLKEIEAVLELKNVPVYNDDTKYGLRFVKARVLNDEVTVILVCGRGALNPQVYEEIGKINYVESVYYTVNTSKDQNFAAGRYMKVYGKTNQEVTFMSQKYVLTPKTSFPVNFKAEELMINEVKKLINPETKDIFHINCECGTLSNALTEYNVKAIDGSKYNIQDAKYSLKLNRLEHVDYEDGYIPEIVEKIARNKEFDLFIVNEPLLGMRREIKESIVKSGVKEVIYISRNASSFAKDVGSLEDNYTLTTVVPIDFESYNQGIVIIARLVKNDKKRH